MESSQPNLFMVFDVEAIGLHGEGFAVGFVLVDREGNRQAEGLVACPRETCSGTPDNHVRIAQMVAPITPTHAQPRDMRTAFWNQWLVWKERGAVLVADCCWPVESRFLAACVDDDPVAREWQGPFPLHDLATLMLAQGLDPLATPDRREYELPAHNPLADARQSARILAEALGSAKSKLQAGM